MPNARVFCRAVSRACFSLQLDRPAELAYDQYCVYLAKKSFGNDLWPKKQLPQANIESLSTSLTVYLTIIPRARVGYEMIDS